MPYDTITERATAVMEHPAAWALVVGAYLLGAVPFGLIVARIVKGIDIRTIGSGNIGATNAIRAMGRRWGFLVFGLDFLKGYLPGLLAKYLVETSPSGLEFLQVVSGTAAVLGHCYPVYLRFKGGKGVATGCGAIVAMDLRVFVCGGIVWLITRLATGYAGFASILMGVTFPIAVYALEGTSRRELLAAACLLTLLIVVRHRANIRRMLAGTEPNARDPHKQADDPPPAARPHG